MIATIEKLLQKHPELREVKLRQRLGPGYSGCRVYLALPDLGTPARNAWIIKVGPTDEITHEVRGYTIAKSFVPSQNIIHEIANYSEGPDALILYDFAGFSGKPPFDLEQTIRRIEAESAVKSVAACIEEWSKNITWKSRNIGELLKSWTASKVDNLPATLLEARGNRTLNSPDFGESLPNPAYYIHHGLTRQLTIQCPLSFVHGDLNLHNALFNVIDANVPDVERPLIIDFRHSTSDGISFIDLAKIEACIRYQLVGKIDGVERLQQIVSFLESSRNEIDLRSVPEALGDKLLQDLWRCLGVIRSSVTRILGRHREESAVVYWASLFSYAFSTATYSQLSLELRHLAYLDAAAIMGRHIEPRDAAAPQRIIRIHDTISPPVYLGEVAEANQFYSLLLRSLERRQGVLIIGPSYGKVSGYEGFSHLVQRIYRELTADPAPSVSTDNLLVILARRKPRHEIAGKLSDRLSRWRPANERNDITGIEWAAVFNWHFHDDPLQVLREDLTRTVLRVEDAKSAVSHFDSIRSGALPYVPLYGDVQSKPDHLALTAADQRQRAELTGLIAQALEQHQRPLSLVFWKCEELSVDDLVRLRSDFADGLSVPVDSFFLSDQDDPNRDQALQALDVFRVRGTLGELKLQIRSERQPAATYAATTWQAESSLYQLPDVGRLSRGFVDQFDRIGAMPPITSSSSSSEFLLGNSPTIEDISSGRVVRRRILDTEILPAVRALLEGKDRQFQTVIVQGRAGAGVTTLLCLAAHHISSQRWAPVYLAARAAGRRLDEWREAGDLLAEVSRVTERPVILIVDAADVGWQEIELLVGTVLEKGGEIVPILGGRRELIRITTAEVPGQLLQQVEVADSLSGAEWATLARILQQNGFAKDTSTEDLTQQLAAVGQLLPAIYQATDRMNRKFREIVAYEYHRYDSDPLVQRAYRFICYLGAFGLQLTQVWLLKALGNRSLRDSAHILGRLSDDIVLYGSENSETGEVGIGPRHRLIAEEVLNIAVPDPAHRLIDFKELIGTANLASTTEGAKITRLLAYKGQLISWIRETYTDRMVQYSEISVLYEAALSNQPLAQGVEITLRQHLALTLRYYGLTEEALEHIIKAMTLEPNNPATIHIAGLIHVTRALDSWKVYSFDTRDQTALGHALSNEEDALGFFRRVRQYKRSEEYGYESEARYFSKKARMFSDSVDERHKREVALQALGALALLRVAEETLPEERLIEIPRTKAYLLQAIGESGQAKAIISEEIEKSRDPVRTIRLQRTAAALSAEIEDWEQTMSICKELIRKGEHDANMYLLLDRAHLKLKVDPRERLRWIRESAQSWNRRDINTLVRFAELLLYIDDWSEAINSLELADSLGRDSLPATAREKIRGIVKESGPYSDSPKRFEGNVLRLSKPSEGLVSLADGSIGIFFRTSPELSGKIKSGSRVSYSVAWRIRGLRAVNLRLLEVSN